MRIGRSSRRRAHRRGETIGIAPGTLVRDPEAQPPRMHAFVYDQERVEEHRPTSVQEVAALRERGGLLWLDVAGLGDVELLRGLGDLFSLHRLALEDVVNTHQRAKVEDYPGHLFLVLRMVNPGTAIDTEQWSLCLGEGFVVTFQERDGDCFDGVRERLRKAGTRLRQNGPDQLAYSLLDTAVDAFFPVLESMGDRLETIEERILANAAVRVVVGDLHGTRRELLVLRRALWPLRDLSSSLARGELARFKPSTAIYLRDVHDHVVQLLDLLENYREMATSLMDVHLAMVSNRLNEVMRVLTVIATIFIPLTFVAGVYGMNFVHMPELKWEYGYPVVMGGMALAAIWMLLLFRRRGWIGSGASSRDRDLAEE